MTRKKKDHPTYVVTLEDGHVFSFRAKDYTKALGYALERARKRNIRVARID